MNPWHAIPRQQRSIVRAYINSEQPQDRERALVECVRYGLDYQEMRTFILREMIEQSKAIEAKRARAERASLFAPAGGAGREGR